MSRFLLILLSLYALLAGADLWASTGISPTLPSCPVEIISGKGVDNDFRAVIRCDSNRSITSVAHGNLLPAETAAGWAFSGDGELTAEEDDLDGSGSARITVMARDLAQPTFAQNISATVHDRTEAMGIGNVPLTGFPEVIGSPEIDIHDPGSLATREIRVRFTGRDTAVDPDTPVIWHCSNGTLLPEELTLGPDGIAIAHITSQNAHVGPALIYAQAGNAKVWIDSVQFTPGDGAWVEVTTPLLADSSGSVTVEGIAADKQITVTRTSMITVHGTAGARMRVGFRQPADTRDGRFAAPGPLQQPGWYGEALRIVHMSGGPSLATDGTFTMPASGVAGFTLESNGPPAGKTSVIALVSAVILQTPAGGGEIELPVAPALVASTSAKVAAGIFDVAQCLVTGQPQTVTGHATDIGVSCLPVWGDGRDIILNVSRRLWCGSQGEDATLANLELTFATIGLISDLPLLDVSSGPAAAVAKDIIKVTRQLCKRLQYGAPVMFLAYTDFARKLPAILASKIGLSIGESYQDFLDDLSAMLGSLHKLDGLTDAQLAKVNKVFIGLGGVKHGPATFRRMHENFPPEATEKLYRALADAVEDGSTHSVTGTRRVCQVLAETTKSDTNAAFIGLVDRLSEAELGHFVGTARDLMSGTATHVNGKDRATLRRLIAAARVYDTTAYAGATGTVGLKELLENFNKIKSVPGGLTQIRLVGLASEKQANFARGFRGEMDDMVERVKLNGGNIDDLEFGWWVHWKSDVRGRWTKTNIDGVYQGKAYFRKSSVAQLSEIDPKLMREVFFHTRKAFEARGKQFNGIVMLFPGGKAAMGEVGDKLQAIADDMEFDIDFQDIIRLQPYPGQ